MNNIIKLFFFEIYLPLNDEGEEELKQSVNKKIKPYIKEGRKKMMKEEIEVDRSFIIYFFKFYF